MSRAGLLGLCVAHGDSNSFWQLSQPFSGHCAVKAEQRGTDGAGTGDARGTWACLISTSIHFTPQMPTELGPCTLRRARLGDRPGEQAG